MLDMDLLDRVRERYAGLADVHKVVVFGSRARGDARADSDLDLMVVADVDGSPAERVRLLGRPLNDLGVPIDLVVYTPAEYQRFRRWTSSAARAADDEGIVLHG